MSAPVEFPPGFADYQSHRSRYLDARNNETAEWCAKEALRRLAREVASSRGPCPRSEEEAPRSEGREAKPG